MNNTRWPVVAVHSDPALIVCATLRLPLPQREGWGEGDHSHLDPLILSFSLREKGLRNMFRGSLLAGLLSNMSPHRIASWACLLALLMLLGLSGCGGGSTTQNPDTSGPKALDYTGPAASTADVQAFKLNVWDNLRASNRCGACHGAGGQSPNFVRQDDVNLAYAEANTLVNLTTPADSRMVVKVSGGHNCWLQSSSACGEVLTAYITAWAGGSVGGPAKQIQLVAPPLKDAGASKSFPADASLFAGTVHPLLKAHCAGCHTDTSATPQAPFFAVSDAASAYAAVTSSHKIDLDTPANSRLVVRLRDEFHNCWSDCQSNANEMLAAITTFANGVPVTPVDPKLVISKALTLTDGIIASGGSRNVANVIALYEFKTGTGTTAYDTSGVEPALNLTLSGDVGWVSGWGIEIRNGKAQGTTAASSKLSRLIKSTGEYTIEAWLVPANVTQEGPARIISYSGGTTARNFTLGQTLYNYDFLQRSSNTDGNGEPALSTADAAERLQATQQHVVVTYTPTQGRRIYVNGVDTGDQDPVAGGSLADWDDSFAFVLGNEVSGDRLWKGKLRMVAIHNRALTTAQILQNYKAGVGEKYYLLFDVSTLVSKPQSYILFEVSQFDNYSYLFLKPTFISLDPTVTPGNIPLRGLHIGINGKEAKVGQAYSTLDTAITDAKYSSNGGQVLSDIGAVIASEKGATADEFFLDFASLNGHDNVVTEPVPLQPPPPADSAPVADIGVRTFDAINSTMAALTGVSPTNSNVKTTFDTIKQQLPTVANIEGFMSAHQVAVAQLAIEYCNALGDDTALRAAYFPTLDFSASASSAFADTTGRNRLIDPLLTRMLGSNIATQPDSTAVRTELDSLIVKLAPCSGSCGTRTVTVTKAACAATLGSAAMLVQ